MIIIYFQNIFWQNILPKKIKRKIIKIYQKNQLSMVPKFYKDAFECTKYLVEKGFKVTNSMVQEAEKNEQLQNFIKKKYDLTTQKRRIKSISSIDSNMLKENIIKNSMNRTPKYSLNIESSPKKLVQTSRNRLTEQQSENQVKVSVISTSKKSFEKYLISQSFYIDIEQITFKQKIGFGGYSLVFLGAYCYLPVAIKQISIQSLQLDKISNILKEIEISFKLRHPNIVQSIGVSLDPENFFIISEYLEFNSLQKVLSDDSIILNHEQKIDISLQITRAMIYMHAQKPQVLHRDLKTANCLCDKNFKIKLCDFGNSKVINANSNFNTKTIGTTEIMAPEYIVDQQFFDKSDIYSFGVVLWEIFTRKTPYSDKYPAQIAYDISVGKRLSLEGFDRNIQNLINDCWQQDYKQRPSFEQIYFKLQQE